MEKAKHPIIQLLNPKWLLIGLFILIFLVIGGQSAKLTCKHTRQAGTVNCIKVKRLLWITPLGTSEILDVRGAQIASTYADETGETYRVELITGKGIVPINSVYTSGYSTKSEVADQINGYIQHPTEDPLTVTEPGLMSLENVICAAIWLPIAWAMSAVWGKIKSFFGGRKNQ